jgi:alkanesulfonate monooxygenase SsuD/methylene tetrahydromethanopterin reductase-like flavin-dependent oxidoreductase (luciferase family)
VGGGGERKTLRLVAQYADACNIFAFSPDDVAHKLEVLARHCDDIGRDPATIEKTILAMASPLADPDGFVAQMAEYAAIGIECVEVMPVGDPVAFTTEVGDRILPALAELGPS